MKPLFEVEWRVLYCTLSTGLSSFMVGYGFALPSPIARVVKSGNLLDDYQFGIFSGIFYLAAAISGLTAIPMMYWLGRKTVIVIAAFISAAGWILLGSSRVPELLICARVVTGLGSGLSIPILPIYIAELANKDTRGRHLSVIGFNLTFGVLVLFALGIKLNYFWLAMIGTCICILQLILLLFAPSSPAYLVDLGLEKRALSTLKKLRCKNYDAMSEILEMMEAVKDQEMKITSKIKTLFKLNNMKALIMIILILMTDQMSGINLLSSYSSELLTNDKIDANLIGIVYPLAMLLGSVLNVFLIDKVGRKILLLISYIGITIALVLLAIYLLLIDVICPVAVENIHMQYSITDVCLSPYLIAWPMFCIMFFSIVFGLGIGGVCYILLGELIPLKIKHLVSGIGIFMLFMTSFVLITLYPIVTNSIPRCYFLFGVSMLFMILCVITFVFTPETKGKSVAELEEVFTGKTIFIIDNL